MEEKVLPAEERIKKAAEDIFTLHGLEGARMQDIADAAGINKAMLHYYFRNKENLFDIIISEKMSKVFAAFNLWFDDRYSLKEKFANFISAEITIISEFPVLPLFVLLEARKNPKLIPEKLAKVPLKELRKKFHSMITEEHKKGNIRKTTMEEVLINTMSLCIYPIVAAPLLQHILDMNDTKYQSFIEERKSLVADWMVQNLEIK